MTLTLILMRHAKSGWGDPASADHDRTLTERGHRAARAVGRWLREAGHVPELILTSDAVRTVQTVAGLTETLSSAPPVTHRRALYHAAPHAILQQIATVQDARCLLVCGHNPGIGGLAQRMAISPPDHARFDDYPTAATTVIACDAADWSAPRPGRCLAFVTPADIGD